MNDIIEIRELSSGDNRLTFDCGETALNRYIREQASQDVKRRLNKCFVAVKSEASEIVGFYTLSASNVSLDALPLDAVRKLPRYPVLPVGLIGRLAADIQTRGTGLGRLLLGNAVDRIAKADIGTFAVIVDAKSEAASAFYRRYGFMELPGTDRRLFLPVAMAKMID